MIVDKCLGTIPIQNDLLALIAGSVITALAISLGMAGMLALVGFPVNPALPSAFGAIGAALLAARVKAGKPH